MSDDYRLLANAAAKYEQLRDVVVAWCDAEDAYNALWALRGTRTQAKVHDAEAAIDATLAALRKAVGR